MNSLTPVKSKALHINWNLTKRCNYDCSYCPTDTHDNTSTPPTLDELQLGLSNLPLNGTTFSFSGGEPTIIKDFIPFVQSMNNTVSIATNGSCSADYYIELLDHLEFCTFTYHFEYVDDDQYINKLHEIAKWHDNYKIQIMVDGRYIDRISSLNLKGLNHTFRPIAKKNNPAFTDNIIATDFPYTESRDRIVAYGDDIPIYSGNQLIQDGTNRFKDWWCSAGQSYLHILHDGTVYRGSCRVGGALGNVYKDKIQIQDDGIICDKYDCTCAPEILLRKHK